MIIGYISESNLYTSLAEQKEAISRYAKNLGFSDVKFLKIPKNKTILSSPMAHGDTIIISDVSILGPKFEDIMLALKLFSQRKVNVYSVKEGLAFDTTLQGSISDSIDNYLKIYKGILSLKNSRIQKNLLKDGKLRGRPVGTGSNGLDERKEEIKSLLSCGVKVTEIAKAIGVNKSTLYMFIKRKLRSY